MRILQFLVCFILTSLPAAADIYADCQKAIDSGDKAAAEGFSAVILRFNSMSAGQQEAGAACISFAKDKEYVYDLVFGAFVEPSAVEAVLQEKREEVAAKAKLDAENEAAANARMYQLAKESAALEAAKAEKIQAVWGRVFEACNDLYADDPTEALTKQVCLDVFLQTGLPLE